jgi:hypothetical protein
MKVAIRLLAIPAFAIWCALIPGCGGGGIQTNPPVAKAIAEPKTQFVGKPVHFYDEGSYDPDGGEILYYDWDWENNGKTWERGSNVYHTWNTPGKYKVQFRVTNDKLSTDMLDKPLDITIIQGNLPPIASADAEPKQQAAGQQVHFFDTGSNDPDGGDIWKYEWDWNNDGTYDQVGPDLYHTWDTVGTYHVQFRVTDDESVVDTLDTPIEIIIGKPIPHPVEVKLVDMIYGDDIAVSGQYAYISQNASLQIIDIDPPESAHIINTVEIPETAGSIVISGGYAYVTTMLKGLQIIDIDPPESAYIVNAVDTPDYANSVDVHNGYAYVADSQSGLQIIDIDPIESAHIVNAVDTSWNAVDVAVSGGYAYLTVDMAGLQIIDIDPPEAAFIKKTVDFVSAYAIALSDGYAYIGGGYYGLRIIDIDPPDSAQLISTVDTPQDTLGICISNGYAFVADLASGFDIIDVSPPESAFLVKTIDIPGNAWDVTVSGDYAYVVDREYGLRIFKIW